LRAKHRPAAGKDLHQAITVVVVRGVPWWGVIFSAAAPALMVGGWTVAAGLQPRSFDPVAQTVSALAAPGAADRWVMTLTFLVVGVCDFATRNVSVITHRSAAPGADGRRPRRSRPTMAHPAQPPP
jgi:hypothetical protein